MKLRHRLLIALMLAAAIAVAAWVDTDSADSCSASPGPTPIAAGAPSLERLAKVAAPASLDGIDVAYTGFDVNFNPAMHQPNYVAWVLIPDHTDGPFKRKNSDFAPDPKVKGCPSLADYKNSGYDRGHMAPAADMKWDAKAMADCHYLTNMCPQRKELNTGAWATVEKNTRKWALKHGPLVIVAGPVLSDRLLDSIGKSRIPVPERFFKVIIAPEATPPLGIAFIMPNSYVEGGAQATVASIDQVEAITGFDFFAALPDDIENNVESQSSLRLWNR